MATKAPRVVIVGAGIAGLAATLALRRAGCNPVIYERVNTFGTPSANGVATSSRIGAAITISPNGLKVLDYLGVGEEVRRLGYASEWRENRTWDTGEVFSRLELGKHSIEKYGGSLITMHRSDLISALEKKVGAGAIQFQHNLASISEDREGVHLKFENGVETIGDALIAADGIHSRTRAYVTGSNDSAKFTGIIAYRATAPRAGINWMDTSPFIKWWGADRQSELVTFPISSGEEIFLFASTSRADWRTESWTEPCDPEEMRQPFKDWHHSARRLLDLPVTVLRTALYDREPLSSWTRGSVALMGDAAHPMTPFMAQGSAMGLEDAAVLGRCFSAVVNSGVSLASALAIYDGTRIHRASKVQRLSFSNQWLRDPKDADEIYSYNAMEEELCS